VKKAIAAARSSTTTLTWSNLLIVMSLVSQRPLLLRLRGATADGADVLVAMVFGSQRCGPTRPKTLASPRRGRSERLGG
jgi:hypothetical protein